MKEKIEQLEKELAELKAEIEKSQQSEKWQDKLVQPNNSGYNFIVSSLEDGLMVAYSNIRNTHRKPEHAFATEEQTELIKEKMLLMQEMYAFAHVKNDGWKPDWSIGEQIKWGLNVHINEPLIEWHRYANHSLFGIAVKSKEIAIEMLEIFGERIKKYYNEQY